MQWDDSKYREKTKKIIECFYRVHKILGPGLLEKAYHNALIIELKKHFKSVESEKHFDVWYDDCIVSTYRPDILIDEEIIVETKALKELTNDNIAQIISQLRVTKILIGFLVNFSRKELEFKRLDNFFELKKLGLMPVI